ncbi:sulfate/anion exchanger-like protein [Dinothrombium tinctorium]|uniref:Sulfate/anion exchanger-like protein n=1 Tax=Dinothrombium tinctorium TaxID=1965070 RepID=A0A3S3NP08_9ACAR|nr:sulfate/anion exchanger-like protein [Dinothrombium tinctorium]
MAILAQLPVSYGLYSSFIGPFLYIIFGSCKDITIGPTSIMAIITAQYVKLGGPNYAVLLSFLAGIIQLIFGILNLGFLVEFIPFPVISGFSSAAAITITLAQLKLFLGLKRKQSLIEVFRQPKMIKAWDSLLGVFCLIILISLKLLSIQLAKKVPAEKAPILMRNKEKRSNFWNAAIKMLITSRNALLVLLCALLVYLLPNEAFTLTENIEPGLPTFKLPNFTEYRNGTLVKSFPKIINEINYGMLIVAMLSVLETIAIAKSLENSSDLRNLKRSFEPTQEMIVLGLSNLIGSFFGSFPVTGSFSRSAINHSSGVRTPLSNIITGAMVLISLSSLIAPYFHYIPQTTLASVIISSVIFMIKPEDVKRIWKTSKPDLLPFFVTFITAIAISLEFGILLGSCLSLFQLAYNIMRPEIKFSVETMTNGLKYILITPNQSILYPAAEYLKTKIMNSMRLFRADLNDREYNLNQFKFAIVVDCVHIFRIDATVAFTLKQFVDALYKKEILVIFYRLPEKVAQSLDGIHICETESNLFEMLASFYNQENL